MDAVMVISPLAFERALTAARQVGEGDELVGGLTAPLGAGLRGRVDEAWDRIEAALRQARRQGLDRAQDLIEAAVAKTEELLEQAGAKARELEATLTARIQEFLRTLIDGALSHVRETLQIGGRTVQLTKILVAQRITLGGSLKASIQEICSLTSSGELAITAEYAAPASG